MEQKLRSLTIRHLLYAKFYLKGWYTYETKIKKCGLSHQLNSASAHSLLETGDVFIIRLH